METESNWSRLKGRKGRNELPHVLRGLFESGELDLADLAEGVANAWVSAESPKQELGAPYWLEMLESTGFILDGERAANPETSPLKLFRGASFDRQRQMSWTEDLELASWFATRSLGDGHLSAVWSATVQPKRLLAHINSGREGESEWVVNPQRMQIGRRLGPEDLGFTFDPDTWVVRKIA